MVDSGQISGHLGDLLGGIFLVSGTSSILFFLSIGFLHLFESQVDIMGAIVESRGFIKGSLVSIDGILFIEWIEW
jgi:hypothetical protein